MARLSHDAAVVNARIVYWGIEGSGKTTNLRVVHRKLRPDHRGEIESLPTRIDPTVHYEVLPIELGEIAGLRTQIQMVAVPGGPDQAPTRKQLLDQVDGIVLVIDSRPECQNDNAASLAELREALADYGRRLEDVPLVLQYNKRDQSDPYTLEALYRRLDVSGAAVFEAVATETTGVLQTLSTLSKRVIRTLRGQQFEVEAESADAPSPAPAAAAAAPAVEPDFDPAPPTLIDLEAPAEPGATGAAERMEDAILAESAHPDSADIASAAASAEDLLDANWNAVDAASPDDPQPADFDELSGPGLTDPMADLSGPHPLDDEAAGGPRLGPELSIAEVGEATRHGQRGVRVPVVVSDKDGRRAKLVLTITLDALLDGDTG